MNYEKITPLVKKEFKMTIKGENKNLIGFTYIIALLKSVYGINVYNGRSIQDKMLKNINDLITEYNTDYTSTKWVTKDINNICNPLDTDYPCNPKEIFSIKDIPLLNGRLRVKNKMVEFCNEKCGPDCKDGCFFVPMITLNHTESEYFSNVINNCACIPCYDYISQTGDIKCFQKDTVPEILQILLDNFKKIYAASNDSNPRTAYYIFVDTFDNETDAVNDDIRKMVYDLQKFINKCKNPSSSDVQKECEKMNRTKNQANSSCLNSKKIFCSNIDPEIPNTDPDNCIKKKHGVVDVIRDNINFYLDSTISESCYCESVNPIDGTIISSDQAWMKRNECEKLNSKSSNFHICNDDSFAVETLKHMRELKKKCSDGDNSIKCKPNNVLNNIYDSYTFDFTYNNMSSMDNCNGYGGDSNCYIYKTDKSIEKDIEKSIISDENIIQRDYDSNIDVVKDKSYYKYASKEYCYCHQSDGDSKKCNTFDTCFAEGGSSDSPDATPPELCSKVHQDLFGSGGTFENTMSAEDFELARDNIISRDICEQKLGCLGYKCENGGMDNPPGSRYNNDESNMSYIRSFFSSLTPSYTGLSLNHNLWDQIAIPLNSNDQTVEISMKPVMNLLTGSPTTLTSYVKQQGCETGNIINQYANIDKRMAAIESEAITKEKQSMSQIYDPSIIGGCVIGEITNIVAAAPAKAQDAGASVLNFFDPFGNPLSTNHSKSISTPTECKQLGDGYSNFLSNISSFTSNYIDRTENQIMGGILGSVGEALSNGCPTEEDNRGISVDYSSLLTALVILISVIGTSLSILFGGPLIIIILGFEMIIFWIYDKIFSTKKNIESITNDQNIQNWRFIGGTVFLIISVLILKKTKFGNSLINKNYKNFRKTS